VNCHSWFAIFGTAVALVAPRPMTAPGPSRAPRHQQRGAWRPVDTNGDEDSSRDLRGSRAYHCCVVALEQLVTYPTISGRSNTDWTAIRPGPCRVSQIDLACHRAEVNQYWPRGVLEVQPHLDGRVVPSWACQGCGPPELGEALWGDK
jgi:hypothetical protein